MVVLFIIMSFNKPNNTVYNWGIASLLLNARKKLRPNLLIVLSMLHERRPNNGHLASPGYRSERLAK